MLQHIFKCWQVHFIFIIFLPVILVHLFRGKNNKKYFRSFSLHRWDKNPLIRLSRKKEEIKALVHMSTSCVFNRHKNSRKETLITTYAKWRLPATWWDFIFTFNRIFFPCFFSSTSQRSYVLICFYFFALEIKYKKRNRGMFIISFHASFFKRK